MVFYRVCLWNLRKTDSVIAHVFYCIFILCPKLYCFYFICIPCLKLYWFRSSHWKHITFFIIPETISFSTFSLELHFLYKEA